VRFVIVSDPIGADGVLEQDGVIVDPGFYKEGIFGRFDFESELCDQVPHQIIFFASVVIAQSVKRFRAGGAIVEGLGVAFADVFFGLVEGFLQEGDLIEGPKHFLVPAA